MKFFILWVILFCSAASADNSRVPAFKAICNEEAASGLRPTPDGWRPTHFKSEKIYFFEKKNGECEYEYEKIPDYKKNRGFTYGCYLIQDLNQKSTLPTYPQLCEEWGFNRSMEDPLFRVNCGHIVFNPTNGYLRYSMHQGINAPSAVGNDIFVAAGSCRIIQ